MKKIKMIFLLLIVMLGLPIMVNAASGTISVSSSSTAVVGNTLTVTVTLSSGSPLGSWEMDLSYNSSYLRLVSSTASDGGTHMVGYVGNSNTYQTSYTFRFTVLKSGKATVGVNSYLVYAYDESQMAISSNSKTLTLMTQAELEATYSKNNNLKSLSIDGYSLTPDFNADVLEYSVSVPSDVTSVNIQAEKQDSTATIDGTGEHAVNEGTNSFEISVQAQNGDIKVYKVLIQVEDTNPIHVTINNEDYVLVKRKDNLAIPNSFEEKTIKMNDFEIPAFYSETLGYTLVGLKNNDGDLRYAIYDESKNSYELYNENKSDQLLLYIKNITSEKDGFVKDKVTIQDISYDCFKSNDGSITLIYAMNIVTGKENYYMYDKEDNTFLIYNDAMITSLMNDNNKYKNTILYMAGGIIFLIIIIFGLLLKKSKRSKVKRTVEPEVKVAKIEKKASKKDSSATDDTKEEVQKKKEKSKKTKEEALEEVNKASEIIENYEKTIRLSQKELAKKKKEMEEQETKQEVTMYDIFADDKKKKKKK